MNIPNKIMPVEYDSLESVIDRLGRENHYEEKNWVNSVISLPRETHLNFLYQDLYLQRISDFSKIPLVVLKMMTVQRFIPYFYTPDEIGNLPLEQSNDEVTPMWDESKRNTFIGQPQKFCSKCCSTIDIRLLPWILRPITTCGIHNVVLLDRCPYCGHLIEKNQVRRCICNINLEENLINLETEYSRQYSLISWQKISCLKSTVDMGFTCSGYIDLSSPYFFHYIWNMGSLLYKYDPSINNYFSIKNFRRNQSKNNIPLRQLGNMELHHIFTTAFSTLIDWPNNFHFHLEQVIQNNGKREHSFIYDLQKHFRLMEWDWLWSEIRKYVQNNLKKYPVLLKWHAYIRSFSSNIVAIPSFGNAKPNQSTPTEEENRLAIPSLDQAAQILGISKGNLKRLVNKGIIHPCKRYTANRRTKWNFLEKELRIFIQRVQDISGSLFEVAAFEETVPLCQAVRMLIPYGIGFSEVICLCLEKKLKGYYRFKTLGNLSELAFIKSDVISFRTQQSSQRKNQLLSAYEVMRILHCSRSSLRNLDDGNLLIPKQKEGDSEIYWIYAHEDLRNFKEKIITSKEVAEIVGVSPHMVTSWARNGWIPCLLKPTGRGTHFYWFDKNEVQVWRKEILSSKEVKGMLGIKQRTFENWVSKGVITPIQNMCQHPYWFSRVGIENVLASRHGE